jgi:hypothetical protein
MPINPNIAASDYTAYVRAKSNVVGRKFVPPDYTSSLLSALTVNSDVGKSLGNKPLPPISGYLTFEAGSRVRSAQPIPNIGTSDFTIEFFANITYTSAQYGENIFKLDHQDGSINVRIGDEGIIIDDEIDVVFECAFPTALFNSWHHYALCRRSGDFDFYVDGARVSLESFTTTSAVDENPEINIGYGIQSAFPGKLTNFRITKVALYPGTVPSIPLSGTDSILLILATAGGPITDSSPYEAQLVVEGTVVVSNGPVLTTPPIFSQYGVLEFDGDSHLEIDGTIDDGTSNFTIEWYMRPTSYEVDVFQIYTSTDLDELFCFIDESNLVVLFGDNGAGNAPLYGYSGVVTPVLLNEWHKYAIQRISTTEMEVLIDGIVVGSFTIPETRVLNGDELLIGYDDFGDKFVGSITNFRISTGLQNDTLPLSGGEVLLLADPFNPFSDSSGNDRGVDNDGVTNSLGPITVDLSTTTILRYSLNQGSSINWDGTIFRRNVDLPGYSYTAIIGSTPDSTVPFSTDLISVTIGNLVTSIGDEAFVECYNLATVTFSEPSLLETIGDYAFQDTALTSIVIPGSVTDIEYSAFYNCTSLKRVTFASPSSLETIGESAFERCEELTSIVIPASVISIVDDAFRNCYVLNTVTFASPSSLETIGTGVFRNCYLLRSITIPASVTSIGQLAFRNCDGLNTVTFASPSLLETIGYAAFDSCESLGSIVIPASVTTIEDDVFFECTKLETVTFAAGSLLDSIGVGAFTECTLLTTITIPALVTSIGDDAFTNSGLTTVIISAETATLLGKTSPTPNPPGIDFFGKSVATILPSAPPSGPQTVLEYGSTQGDVIDWNGTTFTRNADLPNFSYTAVVTSIPAVPVPFSADLLAVTIGNVVTSIGDNAFENCESLQSIVIPASVETIGYEAFYTCINLETVTFAPNSELQSIGNYAFRGCELLRSITIPASVTSIGQSAFRNCYVLNTVTFASPSSLETIGTGVFRNCYLLRSITIPASVETIGDYAFYDCVDLASVTFAAGSLLGSIGDDAFSNCESLESIVIPASVESIGADAFEYCYDLETVTFTSPSSLQNIDGYAFYNCTLLTTITIPDLVTSIGDDAFTNSGLTTVTISTATASVLGKTSPTANPPGVDFFGRTVATILP